MQSQVLSDVAVPALALPDGSAPILSISPMVLPATDRLVPLQLRVTAPVKGGSLPVVLLSHGHGPSNYVSSLYGYAPLVNALAASGFAVIQPTHLDSRTLPFRDSDHPDAPLFWRSRIEDMKRILDELESLEANLSPIAGRLDRDRVAVVGHSMGGHTASLLLGAQHAAHHGEPALNLRDVRIRAGALLATAGRGSSLSATAAKNYPFFTAIDFSTMQTPALVVRGDADDAIHLTTAGPSWFADPYLLSPAPKSMLTLLGAGHSLGGVSGYDAAETTDEAPERVALVQRLLCAYLRSQLYPGDAAYERAQRELRTSASALGVVESK